MTVEKRTYQISVFISILLKLNNKTFTGKKYKDYNRPAIDFKSKHNQSNRRRMPVTLLKDENKKKYINKKKRKRRWIS